ncbi:hypothetical protein ACFSR7_33210 [Cohnella sp. GCM10020058]
MKLTFFAAIVPQKGDMSGKGCIFAVIAVPGRVGCDAERFCDSRKGNNRQGEVCLAVVRMYCALKQTNVLGRSLDQTCPRIRAIGLFHVAQLPQRCARQMSVDAVFVASSL